MALQTVPTETSEFGQRARSVYEQLRLKVETAENIGKLIVIDVNTGDYEIDDLGIESSRLLKDRHPDAVLYALRIGYKTAVSFCGALERTDS
jgi:hypothetical protein